MPDQHAMLSASGAHRWLHCTPSAVLESGVPGSTSDAAEQGTAAHALAEYKLRRMLKQRATRPVSEWIDEQMEDLTDDYRDFVAEQLATATQECPDAQLLVEQRLDFSHVVPGGFGTGDAIIVADTLLHVIDLKYGQGVLVEATGNPQLMLYGLGALATFGDLYDITTVQLSIFQPRRGNVDTFTISVDELTDWAQTEVRPRAEQAAVGDGEFCPGSWCQFCRISATCRARAEHHLALAKKEFAAPAELSDAEVAEVLAQIPLLRSWAAEVEAYALAQAVHCGKAWPGFKVVAGRSIRKFTDETAVAAAATAAGFTDIYDRKLISLTAMEQLMGKTVFAETLGDLITRPAGKPALVPDTDKRPALSIRTAADDFTDTTESSN